MSATQQQSDNSMDKKSAMTNAEKCRKYRERNQEKVRQIQRMYCKKNRHKIRAYVKERNALPEVRIVKNQRARLKRFVKSTSVKRSEMFGCTPAELVQHIECQFMEGMTWENYGAWHIDHIIPCSAFDLFDAQNVRICFNMKNMRPLWAEQNLRKGKKFPLGIVQQP